MEGLEQNNTPQFKLLDGDTPQFKRPQQDGANQNVAQQNTQPQKAQFSIAQPQSAPPANAPQNAQAQNAQAQSSHAQNAQPNAKAQDAQGQPVTPPAAPEPCKRCGQENKAKATFCSRCGMRAGASLTMEEFRARLNATQEWFRQGQTERAEAGLQHLLEREIEDVRLAAIYSSLGTIYARTGRGNDAVAAFYAAVRQTPRSGAAYFKLGSICRANGLPREAMECFHVASRLDPNLTQAREALQVTQQERDAQVRALAAEFPALRAAGNKPEHVAAMKAHCEKILALDPTHLMAGNILTDIWEAGGEHQAAMRLSKQLARKYPQATAFEERCRRLENSIGARVRALECAEMARRHIQKGETAAALEQAKAAVQADRTEPQALATLGLAFELNDQWVESRKAFQAALQIEPKLQVAKQGEHRVRHKELDRRRQVVADVLREANRLREEKQFGNALAEVQKAARFVEDDPLIPFLMGRILFEQGNMMGAATHFEQSLESDPLFRPALQSLVTTRMQLDEKLHHKIAHALKEARRFPSTNQTQSVPDPLLEAQEQLKARRGYYAAKLAPIRSKKRRERFLKHEFDVYAFIGQFYDRQERLANATQTYDTLRRLQPKNEEARQLWQTAHARQKQVINAHIDRAKRLRKAKSYDKALTELEHALALDPRNLMTLFHMGNTYEFARQFDKALEMYDQAQALNPQSEQIKQHLETARNRAKKLRAAKNRRQAKTAMKVARIAIRLAT